MTPTTLTEHRHDAAAPRGVAAAAAALLLGFGALALLSATGRWEAGRAMWHYRAATWGDGVLVPSIVGVLVAAAVALPRRSGDTRWASAGAALGALAAVAVQISWLAASDPVVNWTLPAAHRFSLPGWYNAVFTVVTASGAGAAALLSVHRLRCLPSPERAVYAGRRSAAVLCGATMAFGVLLAADSADSLDTSAGQGSVMAAIASVALVVAFSVWLVGGAAAIRLALRGLPPATAVVAASILTHGWPS